MSTIATTGNITTANILPLTDNVYTLGSSNLRWGNLHLGPGTIYITDSNLASHNTAALTVDNGVLFINGVAQIEAPGIANGNTTISLATSGNITFNAVDSSSELSISPGSVNALGNLRVITPGNRTSFQVVNSGLTSVYAPTTLLTTESALSLIGSNTGYQQPRTYTGTMLQITGQDGQSSRVSIDAFGTGAYASIAGRAAQGNVNVPSAIGVGNILMRLSGVGYGTSQYQTGISRIDFQALENFTDTAAGTEIVFWATPTGSNAAANVMQITSTGPVLSSGTYLTFGDGTTQSSAVQQTTGTWTPTLNFATSQGSQTYTTQIGNYVKTGKLVVLNFDIILSVNSGTGNVTIAGLPFTSANQTGYQGSLQSVDYAGSGDAEVYTGTIDGNSSTIALYCYYVDNPGGHLKVKRAVSSDFGATLSIGGTITYISAT